MTIGEKLREARHKKGLSLQEVQADLRIRLNYLEALENDNFEAIPGEAYRRAFLRTYASYLGLDPQEIMSEYDSLYGKPAYVENFVSEEPKTKTSILRPILTIIIAACIIAAAIYLALPTKSRSPQLPAPPIETTPKPETTKTTSPKPQLTPAKPTEEKVSTSTLTLKIEVFQGRSWIEVKELTTGKILFSRTLSEGESFETTSSSPLKLTAGYPPAIRIFVNGREITDFPKRGVLVTTVTTEGISR